MGRKKTYLFAKLKKRCAGCGKYRLKMTKEHFFPRWLIDRSGTGESGIRWIGEKKIPPKAATFPLCIQCNTDFGKELEAPVSQIFTDLENNRGLNDAEAELLIRWLWKFEGLAWINNHPDDIYSKKYTLSERILQPIDQVRGSLVLAIGIIDKIDPRFGDAPMGIDSYSIHNAIFVAGVFLKVAIMVLLKEFEHLVPSEFSKYYLAEKPGELADAKLFYPKVGFCDCAEAVTKTVIVAKALSKLHEEFFLNE